MMMMIDGQKKITNFILKKQSWWLSIDRKKDIPFPVKYVWIYLSELLKLYLLRS